MSSPANSRSSSSAKATATTTARKRRPYAPRVPLEERREQLLDAALAVIVSAGHDRISIDAVAKRAGVARAVVYGAFGDLGALLTALLDRQQARAFDNLLHAFPGREVLRDPAEFAAEAARRVGAVLREDPDTWRLILLTPASMPAVVRDRIQADRERLLARFEEWVDVALEHQNRTDLDAEVLAHALLAVGEHFARLALDEPGRFDAERLAGQVRAVFGAGVR
ncbi:TetR/AcrR family transcriptional regulator [Streptomyces sp. A7024]|uniref:TetR/AcrR family transcriptional regulator n=1 Tax=Streptomyces coryli TaxID=1128680 RepID=A0A6G4U494_9ACTN|nr:TetR/AcrR family transcriptional regulator [Streptomyces coryli]NGN66536.1 TetR/AcrR family transcriptional regulator [Streptomyces coryli]